MLRAQVVHLRNRFECVGNHPGNSNLLNSICLRSLHQSWAAVRSDTWHGTFHNIYVGLVIGISVSNKIAVFALLLAFM